MMETLNMYKWFDCVLLAPAIFTADTVFLYRDVAAGDRAWTLDLGNLFLQ